MMSVMTRNDEENFVNFIWINCCLAVITSNLFIFYRVDFPPLINIPNSTNDRTLNFLPTIKSWQINPDNEHDNPDKDFFKIIPNLWQFYTAIQLPIILSINIETS